MQNTDKNCYIDAEELKQEYAKSQENNNICTSRLGEMFLELANHLLRHKNFVRYPTALKEDMKGYAVLKLIRSIRTIDLENSDGRRVFNYATRTCFTAFLTEIGKYYKQKNIVREMTRKYASTELMSLNPQVAQQILAKLLPAQQ